MNTGPGQDQSVGLKKGWLSAAALIVLAVTMSCSLTTRLFSKATPVPGADAPLGLIAYEGTDGNIYTIDRDGKQRNVITQDAILSPASGQEGRVYQYPTWAPDGQKLAFMGFTSSTSPQTNPQATLYTASSDGKKRVEAFKSQDSLPFYLFWSPNSQYVTFLSNIAGETDLALNLAAAAGGDSKIIGTGQPFYWDWSPDNQAIIVHTGGAIAENPDARLAFYQLDGSIRKKELDLKPGSFQAPAWSPGGDELVLTTDNGSGGEELVLTGRDGSVKRVLAELSGQAAFAWSPEGSRLAYTTPPAEDSSGLFKRLVLLDPARPDQAKDLDMGILLGFFWSPDSQKIAYFMLNSGPRNGTSLQLIQNNQGISLEVQIYDLGSGETKQVAVFTPTDSFLQFLPYFDQYQRSGTIWSPDSKALVLAGIDESGDHSIIVITAAGGKSQKIAAGDLAFWSWK